MSEFQHLVALFNEVVTSGTKTLQEKIELRISLIDEEVKETVEAMKNKDIVSIIDGLCDVLYVTYGAAHTFGIKLDTEFEENQPPNDKLMWAEISHSVSDLPAAAEAAMKAIRDQCPKEMEQRLNELARGCWRCASEALAIDLKPFFYEVHRTNMNKLNGPKREGDGKQLKPAGWKGPRLKEMYERSLQNLRVTCDSACVGASVITKHSDGGYFCKNCGGLYTLNLGDE